MGGAENQDEIDENDNHNIIDNDNMKSSKSPVKSNENKLFINNTPKNDQDDLNKNIFSPPFSISDSSEFSSASLFEKPNKLTEQLNFHLSHDISFCFLLYDIKLFCKCNSQQI
jgi:hypothetical protein